MKKRIAFFMGGLFLMSPLYSCPSVLSQDHLMMLTKNPLQINHQSFFLLDSKGYAEKLRLGQSQLFVLAALINQREGGQKEILNCHYVFHFNPPRKPYAMLGQTQRVILPGDLAEICSGSKGAR